MLIIDLIKQLQAIHDAEVADGSAAVMGEPTIMIDLFHEVDKENHTFHYSGISGDITIDKTSDGVYNVINAFGPDKEEDVKPT